MENKASENSSPPPKAISSEKEESTSPSIAPRSEVAAHEDRCEGGRQNRGDITDDGLKDKIVLPPIEEPRCHDEAGKFPSEVKDNSAVSFNVMSKHGFPKSLPKETGTRVNKTTVSPQNSKMEKKSDTVSVDPRKTSIRFADDTIGAEENIMGQKKKDHRNPDKGKSMNLPHKAGKKNCQPNKKLRATFSSPLDHHDTESVQNSLDDSVVPRSLPVEKPGAFVVDGPQSFSVNNHNVGTELISQGDNDVEQQRTASDESTLVSATLVDESEQPILAKAAPIDGTYTTWKFLSLAALIFLIVSAAIGMPLIMKSRKDDNLISQSPTSVPSPLPTVSLAPSSSPTILPGPRKAFETAEELRLAVDAYLLDGSPNSQVSQKYGYPIGDWNVAQITDFSHVFSFRNANIALFNEDISSWDVSRAVSMESMFEGKTSSSLSRNFVCLGPFSCFSSFFDPKAPHFSTNRLRNGTYRRSPT